MQERRNARKTIISLQDAFHPEPREIREYEGDADAFGVQPPPRVATDASWMMVLVCAACAARMLMQQRRSVSECKS